MEADKKNVLIVWVPSSEAKEIQAYQDYIVDCLEDGVLILPSAFSCEVMELPPLGGVVMRSVAEVEQIATETQQNPEPEPGEDAPPPKPAESGQPPSQAEEKREIIRLLKEYRKTHGRGCLEAVA